MRTILTTLHSKYIHNSLALPCLAAYCSEGCGELIIREYTTHEPRESILAMLLAEHANVIAFSVYLWNRRETLDIVDALHVAQPELKVVLGGPEVSFDGPELFDNHPGVTALVRGEGEEPLRRLLRAWCTHSPEEAIPRTVMRGKAGLAIGPDSPPLTDLDDIPSPFQMGLTDFSRGYVYYETSRGCPFHCSFCLSARDNQIRSYSMARILSDLKLLMDHEVDKVKLVDRTFNYNARRAREIFRFILANNRSTHFHFEIGAQLLDEETLDLLASVPKDTFQFEIGVQSTLENTLSAIDRKVDLTRLEENVRRLVKDDRVHLHLDLVAGLPGDNLASFMSAIDRVIALRPHHLQVEPVKLLPGTPLRDQAEHWQIRFDPNPPYAILSSHGFSFAEIQKIRELSRLLDLTYNSNGFICILNALGKLHGSFASGLSWIADMWSKRGLFRFPLNRQAIYQNLADIISEESPENSRQRLLDCLAYDYAACERVVTSRIPEFFDTELSAEEQAWAHAVVQKRTDEIRGQGIKLQYFSCRFKTFEMPVKLFLYLTQTGKKMQVEESSYMP